MSLIKVQGSSVEGLTASDNKTVNDISTLGLRVHSQENLSGTNTNSSSFDVFQDSTKITSLTNAERNSSEYISAVGTTTAEISYSSGNAVASSSAGGSYAASTAFANNTSQFATASGTNDTDAWYLGFDFGGGNEKVITGYTLDVGGSTFGNGSPLSWTFQGFDDSNMSSGGVTLDTVSNNSGGSNPYSFTNTASTTQKRTWGIKVTLSGSNQYIYVTELNLLENVATVNATGSFQGTAITAPSTSSMGAVITYQDNAGTNTLNTDIVLQLSADNGSNFTTATLEALPDFASGIKCAKVNGLSVTAGTQLKYKISFANQSSGSKEARIRGVSLQY